MMNLIVEYSLIYFSNIVLLEFACKLEPLFGMIIVVIGLLSKPLAEEFKSVEFFSGKIEEA